MQFSNQNSANKQASNGVNSQNINSKNNLLSPPPQAIACFTEVKRSLSFLVSKLCNFTKNA